jgi:hypothetical protein
VNWDRHVLRGARHSASFSRGQATAADRPAQTLYPCTGGSETCSRCAWVSVRLSDVAGCVYQLQAGRLGLWYCNRQITAPASLQFINRAYVSLEFIVSCRSFASLPDRTTHSYTHQDLSVIDCFKQQQQHMPGTAFSLTAYTLPMFG